MVHWWPASESHIVQVHAALFAVRMRARFLIASIDMAIGPSSLRIDYCKSRRSSRFWSLVFVTFARKISIGRFTVRGGASRDGSGHGLPLVAFGSDEQPCTYVRMGLCEYSLVHVRLWTAHVM